MTRDDVNRILMQMEQVRESSYEAETKREERRLIADYNRMSKAIMPYVNGERPYSRAPQATNAQKREMGWKPEEDVTPAAYQQWKANRR